MPYVIRLLLVMSLLFFQGCGRPAPAPLKSIYHSATHGYHAYSNIGYRAERLENGNTRVSVLVGNDRDRVFETEGSLMDSLEALVREYRMDRFKGHYEPKMDILDGDSWSMEICYTDGSSNSCGGYMAYPPRGAEGIFKTEGILSRWLYQEPAEEVALVSFRYEYCDAEGSEAYAFQLKDSVCTAFMQPYGQAKGQTYDAVDPYLAKRIANEIRWNHMASYTGENRADEDKSRPRWILTAEYENGQKIETMDYLDRPPEDRWQNDIPSISETGLRYSVQQIFSEILQQHP
ncbi:MAG: hypothetical protein IKH24_08745 [Bacteroidales bacterium]|nr:hypothetical protein [Bacteroidales bacterium]MBR3450909.1 hypothetical protein [Bacteroidales bacterium]